MAANRLYLVCNGCPQPEKAFCLGERGIGLPLYEPGAADLASWFFDHAGCGTGPDHYQLAHAHTPNHDVATPKSAIDPSVRMALVTKQ